MELKAAKFAILAFTQIQKHLNSILIHMENMVAFSYLVKIRGGGGGKQSGFSGIKKKNLELSNIRTDDSYCQAPTKNFEYGDRLRVQKCEGLKRMTHEDGNLPKALLKPRQTRDRSLSTESVETTQKYISWKTDPFSIGRDAFQTSWSQGLNYAFLTFSLIGRVLAKV